MNAHTLIAGLLTASLLPAAAPGAAVYRCADDEAPPRFSQFPCGGDAVVLEPLHTLRMPPLSEAETRLLDELDARRATERERRARDRQRETRALDAERERRRERCASARAGRRALDRQRRKGYSLEEARALDRREAELDAEAQRNC